jgi:alpha-aminoadipic semialdehyde synthase
LVSKGLQVIVQPSTIRCFSDRDYEEAGAIISEDLSPASTIISVKEVPAHLLIPNRTYMMFSHTIKAQPNNMPLLDTILQKNIRLIDYERIVGSDGRLVRFGPYAGYAGVVDTLHGLGLAFLARGYATPFLHLSFAKEYRSLDTARADLLHLGDIIRKKGLPKEICPLTIVVTGAGSVSLSAQQMLHPLPCKYVECSDLERVWNKESKDTHNLYVAVATPRDMVRPRDATKMFNKADYYKNPDDFVSVFHETVMPYTRVLINGMYWEPKFPRLLTISQAKQLQRTGRFPLVALGDITCDPMGSVEFLVRSTTIANPLFSFDVESSQVEELADYQGKGVIVLGVDHLPAEFPMESTTEFGENLCPLVEKVARSDATAPLKEQETALGKETFRGVVTSGGKLTPNFQYIQGLREKRELECTAKHAKRILVIGGGMCAGPCVRYLMRSPQNHVTVVDTHRSNLDSLIHTYANRSQVALGRNEEGNAQSVTPVVMDVTREEQQTLLRSLVRQNDVIISLLPAYLHKYVAAVAVELGKHVATASYISPDIRNLEQEAKKKNIVLLTEMGLDPGIDILSTAQMLNTIRSTGGVVRSYRSACGALPQPENSDCPLGYKFSWSPRGVLTAVQRPARVKKDGTWISIPGSELYSKATPFGSFRGMSLVAVPNGDAEEYANNLFHFGPETTDIERLTLRYPSFPPAALAFVKLGLMDEKTVVPELQIGSGRHMKWKELLEKSAPGVNPETSFDKETLTSLHELGVLSPYAVAPQTPSGSPLDSLCALLQEKLSYKPHERDMVLMVHEIIAEYTSPTPRRVLHRATLCVRGTSDLQTGTALTVGLPLGIAVQAMLDGEVAARGIVRPSHRQLVDHVMHELYRNGVQMIETETVL